MRLVLESAILEYCLKHPFLGRRPKGVSPKGDEGSWDIDKSFNIQKYDPGQGYFGNHCENMAPAHMARVGVWMIYLNLMLIYQ